MHPLLLRFLSHTFVLRNFSLSVYFCKILIFPSVNLCTVHKIPCLLLTFSGVFLNWTHKFYVLSNFVTFFVQESNCQETADTFLQSLLKLPSADLRDSLIRDYDESLLLPGCVTFGESEAWIKFTTKVSYELVANERGNTWIAYYGLHFETFIARRWHVYKTSISSRRHICDKCLITHSNCLK